MRFKSGRLLTRLLLSAALILTAAPVALAHSRPKIMVPAPDSTGPAPATVSVTFSEALEPKFSSINLTDEKGKQLNTAASVPRDAKTLTLAVPPLQSGDYLVHWVSVAADGHRMEGEYKFTVK